MEIAANYAYTLTANPMCRKCLFLPVMLVVGQEFRTHVGLEAQRAQGHHKSKTVLRLPPVQQLKADLRRAVWNEAVKEVAKVSHERTVIRRLEKLLAA
jgi:hypothetical protein